MTDSRFVPPVLPGMPPLRPIRAGGQPAVDDIVGRIYDIARTWDRLSAGSCLLNEPRRMGKTSLLTKMGRGSKPAGWEFIHGSVQGISSTAELAARVLADIGRHQCLADKVTQTVRAFLESGDVEVGPVKLSAAFRESPLHALEKALGDVSKHLEADGKYLAIAWDEFPDMVVSVSESEGPERAASLLGTLRRFREQNPERIHWLLTGSVGLHHAMRRLSSSGEQYVTDLEAVPLGPLSPEWARWLAGCLLLGSGCRFDTAAIVELASTSDGIPYLLHLLVGWARDHDHREVAAVDVPGLFYDAIGNLDVSHQSTHLLSRLGDYYGDDTALAEWLLDRTARDPATRADLVAEAPAKRTRERDVRRLLELLDRDHYIRVTPGGLYTWRYDALRRIWIQRRGNQ